MSSTYILSTFVLPPTSLIALSLAGALLWRARPRLAMMLVALSQGALLACTLPAVARAIANPLEPPPLRADAMKDAQAIVILGGDISRNAIEWGGESVSGITLQRVRYGAMLARTSGLPVYVTGGRIGSSEHSIGRLMARVLESDYGLDVRWVDEEAPTTRGNALSAAKDLQPLGVQRVVLVTTAIHMPRSQRAFEAAGFAVVPAATDYTAQRPFSAGQLIPSVGALYVTHYALREWVSRGYYAMIGS